jgi:hypothetical protein
MVLLHLKTLKIHHHYKNKLMNLIDRDRNLDYFDMYQFDLDKFYNNSYLKMSNFVDNKHTVGQIGNSMDYY